MPGLGDDEPTCRRCGMELATLVAVDEAAERCLTLQGVAHLAVGDPAEAKQDPTRAQGLHRAPFNELPIGFADQIKAEP